MRKLYDIGSHPLRKFRAEALLRTQAEETHWRKRSGPLELGIVYVASWLAAKYSFDLLHLENIFHRRNCNGVKKKAKGDGQRKT